MDVSPGMYLVVFFAARAKSVDGSFFVATEKVGIPSSGCSAQTCWPKESSSGGKMKVLPGSSPNFLAPRSGRNFDTIATALARLYTARIRGFWIL